MRGESFDYCLASVLDGFYAAPKLDALSGTPPLLASHFGTEGAAYRMRIWQRQPRNFREPTASRRQPGLTKSANSIARGLPLHSPHCAPCFCSKARLLSEPASCLSAPTPCRAWEVLASSALLEIRV